MSLSLKSKVLKSGDIGDNRRDYYRVFRGTLVG